MGGIKTGEILVVDCDNLLDQRVLTLPLDMIPLFQRHERTGDLRWIGGRPNKDGYGVIRCKALLDWLKEKGWLRRDAHSVPVHIFVFLAFHQRALKPDETVDHREGWCPLRHQLCCWPLHIEGVPNRVNAKRGNESNYRPGSHWLRFFDVQCLDEHIPPGLQRVVPLPEPSPERPPYRARRFDERNGLDHEAVQAAFA